MEGIGEMRTVCVEIDHQVGEHVKAERLYYAKCSGMVRVDRVVAVLLLLVGIFGVATAGVRWWTVIWFVLAPLERVNRMSRPAFVVSYWFKPTPKVLEKNALTLSQAGIHLKPPTVESDLKWDLYQGIVEGEDLVLLIYGKRMYSEIPKRCFSSPEDLNAFQELANNQI